MVPSSGSDDHVTPVDPFPGAALLALHAVVRPGSQQGAHDQRLTGSVDIGDEIGRARLGRGTGGEQEPSRNAREPGS